MKFRVLFFVKNFNLFLQKKDKNNNIKKNIKGLKLLKNKKKYLMAMSCFQGLWFSNNTKTLSKFVSIQNQIDKMKNMCIQ